MPETLYKLDTFPWSTMFKKNERFINKTFSMYLNNVVENLFIQKSQLERTNLEALNRRWEIVIVSGLIGSLVIGSYCKCSLYQYMFDKYKKKEIKSIDLLILIQALIEHLVCILMVTTFVIGITLDITFSEYFGEVWCNIPWYAVSFGVCQRTFGGLGIAIIRIFYIKSHYMIKRSVNTTKLAVVSLAISVAISIIMVIVIGMGNGPLSRKQIVWNFCTGKSEKFREVIYYYSLIRGSLTPRGEEATRVCSLVAMAGVVGELICYVLFFQHLYSHDEKMLTSKALSVRQVKKRHQQNAISFIGQFYTFLVKLTNIMFLIYTLNESSHAGWRMIFHIYIRIQFGIYSVVEVMTSQQLKDKLPHKIYFK